MKKATVFRSHSSALAALFVLGNGVIVFPKADADEYTFLAYLLCTAMAFLLYPILIPLINKVYGFKSGETTKSYKKALLVILYFITAAASFFSAVSAFVDFSLFVSELILSDLPVAFSFFVFLLIVVFFVLHRQEVFLKFSLLAFTFTAVVIIFFFIASIGDYKLDSIFIFSLPDFKTLFTQIKEYLFNPMLSVLLIAVYEVFVFGRVRKSVSFWGLGLGFGLLGICILNSVLLFGTHLAAILDFPYASAISTVTIGRLFTRLDGFSYFVYFAACITKITVCLFLIKALFQKSRSLFINSTKNREFSSL